MLRKEFNQWWVDLESSCTKQFKNCLDDVDAGSNECCEVCREYSQNIIESFLTWKEKQDVKHKAEVDN